LLFKPWPVGERVQAQGEVTHLDRGSTDNSPTFDLSTFDTSGRVRLWPGQRADPRFGWNYTQFQTSGDPSIPSDLVDTSVAFGVGVLDYSGWLGGITVGIGYAGQEPFTDGNAWYGMGDFLVGRDIDKTSSLGFVIDYDGNRTFMPDVPLPGVIYTKRLNETLLLGLGFPFSSVEYKVGKLTLSGRFYVPDDAEARIDYEFAKVFGVFGQFNSRREAFHDDAFPVTTDRLLYKSRRTELGFRWSPHNMIDLIVAGGYMFGQEFNQGFDSRNETRVAKPSDEPYVRIGFQFRL
jgi:hypothetical protein